MKIPSLTKIPRHRQFHFEPRYYDPVKEDIAERTKRIKAELRKGQVHDYKQNISEAFSRRMRKDRRAGVTQWTFVVFFAAIFAGYFYFGSAMLYALLAIIPIYIIIKLRKVSW